jgi:hypothetical protein
MKTIAPQGVQYIIIIGKLPEVNCEKVWRQKFFF